MRYWSETGPLRDDFSAGTNNFTLNSHSPFIHSSNLTKGETIRNNNHRILPSQNKSVYNEILKDLDEDEKESELSFETEQNENVLSIPEHQRYIPTSPDQSLDISINMDYSKGVKLTIVTLRNFNLKLKFRVTGGLMESNQYIIDENAKDCIFATQSKNLEDLFFYKFDQSDLDLQLNQNKGTIEPVVFKEEFHFLRNLPGLILMKKNKLDIFLIFQVIGIEENIKSTQNKGSIYQKASEDEDSTEKYHIHNHTKNNDAIHFIAWYAMKLNRQNGTLVEGKFVKHLYKPPMVKPPFESKNVTKVGMQIEFIVEEFIYNARILEKHKLKMNKASPIEIIPKSKATKNNQGQSVVKSENTMFKSKDGLKPPLVQVLFKPFIDNSGKQYDSSLFEKGGGIDIYIDGARFLPDNATITKVKNMFRIVINI